MNKIILIAFGINICEVYSDIGSVNEDTFINLNNAKQINSVMNIDNFKGNKTQVDDARKLEYETFNPCEDGFITLDRFVGLPFEEENYFNGSAHLEKYKKFLPHADLEIALDNPATFTLWDSKQGRVQLISGGEIIHIRTHGLPSVLNFTVRSAALKPFPNLKKVVLSNKVVCENPKKWTPKLLGPPPCTEDIGNRVFIPDDEKSTISCGRRQIEGVALVTQSENTEPGDWPWHVAIYQRVHIEIKKYRCGGTIISPSVILTAAHCSVSRGRPIPAPALSVFTGKYHLNSDDKSAKEYQVSQVIIHNRFTPRNMKNDIALLKLSENITFTDYVQPICLWNFKQISKNYLFGEIGTLVGWGSTKPNSSLSDILRSGTLKMVSDTTCLLSYSDFFQNFLTEDTFCAGTGGPNGTSACNGDSGGGLAFNVTAADGVPTWYMRGIVSISVSLNGTCNPDHYTIFTDSVRYLSWIYANWA